MQLAFLIASLNDLDILAAAITNAHLNAPVKEKIGLKVDLNVAIKIKNQKQKTYKQLFFTNSTKNCTSPTRNARKENRD